MSKYLLELGVEELPYALIDSLSSQIENNLEQKLAENNAAYTDITTYSTPRRLVFIIDGLEEVQPDLVKEYKGPNVRVAITEDGEYSQAAKGFARKFGAEVDALYKIEENGQEFVALKVCQKGKSLQEILPAILPDAVLKVQGSHFMRWSAFDEKFSRPIRWIVSLLDDKEIPVEITGIKSSKQSRAHRFAAEKFPIITSVDNYLDIMLQHNVIVDEEVRKQAIIDSVKELAASIGAEVKIEEELLKEVTNIVEFPRPVLGNFDEKYLAIPEPVIVTVMASHQRYFPIYDKAGNLMNGFITVANYVGDDFTNIKNGNERVIKARLDDAIFFYNEDIKKSLEERVEDLAGITFQKGLGSMKDKVDRIINLSEKIAKVLGYSASDVEMQNVLRTAKLAKADLSTSLVFEFTELQGVIGSHYARVFNEAPGVVTGIKEHYYPVAADAELASSIEGQIVGIADKLDTIVGVFALDKIPSGSVDPLGVRRAAVGILQTIMQKRLQIDIIELIEFAINSIGVEVKEPSKMCSDIVAFFVQRLKGIFSGKYQTDYIDAVLASRDVLNNLATISERLELISSVADTEEFEKIVAAHNRVAKLANKSEVLRQEEEKKIVDIFSVNPEKEKQKEEKAVFSDVLNNAISSHSTISENLFQCDAEDNLYRAVMQLSNRKFTSSREAYDLLVTIVPFIDKFFDDVMVMDENFKIRNNRLNLLAEVNKEFVKVADFTKIIK